MTNGPNLPAKTTTAGDLEVRMDALPALDTTEVVERTLSRILDATEAAAIFANPESQGLRDWAGKVIVVNDVAGCLPTSVKNGALSRYLVLDCTDPDTGQVFAATTGGTYAVAAALRAKEMGLLPRRLRVLELESASNPGQTSLWLVEP